MDTVYTFYHLPGVKVGVTTDLEKRRVVFAREDERYDDSLEVIEQMIRELDDEESWWIVGDHEIELQDSFGYPRDGCHYAVSRKGAVAAGKAGSRLAKRHGNKRAGGLIGGKRAVELGAGFYGIPIGERSCDQLTRCRYCGIISNPGNIARWHNEKCKHQ